MMGNYIARSNPLIMPIRITSIRKAAGEHENPYTAITHFVFTEDGCRDTESVSRESMYEFIMNGGKAYVKAPKGEKAFLVAEVAPDGAKFVKSMPEDDIVKPDYLLMLKECR
jgi:hypothetical protein